MSIFFNEFQGIRNKLKKKPEYNQSSVFSANDRDIKAMDLNKNVNGCNEKNLKIDSCKFLICLKKYYAHKIKAFYSM